MVHPIFLLAQAIAAARFARHVLRRQPSGHRKGLREASGHHRDGRARAHSHTHHRDPDRHLRRRAPRLALRQRVVDDRLHLLRHAGVLACHHPDRAVRRPLPLVPGLGRFIARPRERRARPIVALSVTGCCDRARELRELDALPAKFDYRGDEFRLHPYRAQQGALRARRTREPCLPQRAAADRHAARFEPAAHSSAAPTSSSTSSRFPASAI